MGKKLLCAGGLLLAPPPAPPHAPEPSYNVPGRGNAPCSELLAEVRSRYEAALKTNESDIRTHIPTLLEYARRVRSVAEMGVNRGFSSLAFARAALEAVTRQDAGRYRYRMYDIARTGGVRAISELMGSCPTGVDFAFRLGDVLDEGMVNGSLMEAPELLFIDTTHTYEQVAQELDAFGPAAGKYIILHDTETFGDMDNGVVHDEGSYRSYKRRLQRLRDEQRREVVALATASGGAPHEEALSEALAKAEAAFKRSEKVGLRHAVEDWLRGPRAAGAWMVLEHSAADNGLTVLGRRAALVDRGDAFPPDGDAPPGAANATMGGPCRSRAAAEELAQARLLARGLTDYQANFPGMFGGALHVNTVLAAAVRRRLKAAFRLCPADAGVEAKLRILRRHFSRTGTWRPRPKSHPAASAPTPALPSRARRHPDLFFLAASELPGPMALAHCEEAVRRWPDRVEGWYGLAEALVAAAGGAAALAAAGADPELRERAAHAWRRVVALRGGNRFLVREALVKMEFMGLGEEATLAWEEMASSSVEAQASLWDDPRRHPTRRWLPALTGQTTAFPESFPGHPEFDLAKMVIKQRWTELRTELLSVIKTTKASEVNGFCKDNGWCEYQFLSFEGCMLHAECELAPLLCNAVRDMESGGLRVARAAVSTVGSWEVVPKPHVHIEPHASHQPGRLRLSCTLLISEGTESTMYIAGEAPHVYEEGSCFWFEESLTHEVVHEVRGREAFRATLYLDALHPAYYGLADVEVGHGPSSLGAWQDRISEGVSDSEATDRSVPGLGLLRLHQTKPYAYRARAPDPRPWVKLVVVIQREHADTCILGDSGALFHEVAFRRQGPLVSTAILLGVFRRAEGLLQNAHMVERTTPGGIEAVLARLRGVTAADIDVLQKSVWACMAVGCWHCPAMEASLLCIEGPTRQMRYELLESFSWLMRSSVGQFEKWLRFLGYDVPPPLGWGMEPGAFNRLLASKSEEIKQLNLIR